MAFFWVWCMKFCSRVWKYCFCLQGIYNGWIMWCWAMVANSCAEKAAYKHKLTLVIPSTRSYQIWKYLATLEWHLPTLSSGFGASNFCKCWPEILSNTFKFLPQFLELLILMQNPLWIPCKAWTQVPTNMPCFSGKTCRHWLALILLIGFWRSLMATLLPFLQILLQILFTWMLLSSVPRTLSVHIPPPGQACAHPVEDDIEPLPDEPLQHCNIVLEDGSVCGKQFHSLHDLLLHQRRSKAFNHSTVSAFFQSGSC